MKTIRTYEGKHGDVEVIEYNPSETGGREEWRVRYTNTFYTTVSFGSWHADRKEAILQAQFIASKY